MREATGEGGLGASSAVLSDLDADAESADRAPTSGQREVAAEYSAKLHKAVAAWHRLRDGRLAGLNQRLREAGLPAAGSVAGNNGLDKDSLGN